MLHWTKVFHQTRILYQRKIIHSRSSSGSAAITSAHTSKSRPSPHIQRPLLPPPLQRRADSITAAPFLYVRSRSGPGHHQRRRRRHDPPTPSQHPYPHPRPLAHPPFRRRQPVCGPHMPGRRPAPGKAADTFRGRDGGIWQQGHLGAVAD